MKIVTDDASRVDLTSMLDELVAEGALRMLLAGLSRPRLLITSNVAATWWTRRGIAWWCATGKRRNGPW